MNKMSLLSYGLVLGVSVVLSGCGGGGGSSGPKPASSKPASSMAVSSSVESSSSSSVESSSSVTESSISSSSSLAPSSSSVSSSSAPATTQLVIQGMAVADALVGGEVSFVIGSHTYKTAIDDSLNYSITLDVPNEDIQQPFTAIATGAASNDWVQMAALYPSIIKLQEIAGSDGVLDSAEYLGVNISAMTTAEYSLVVGNKLPIATDAERKYALLTINATDELSRAALLQKILVDINVTYPEKYNTTLEMFLDYEYSRGLTNIYRARGDSFGSVQEFQQDQRQIRLSNKAVAGKFLVSNEDISYLLDLNEDGTGNLLTSDRAGHLLESDDERYRESSFAWVKKGNDIKLTFDPAINYGKVEPNGFYAQSCEQYTGAQDCSIKLDSMVISLITENDVGKIASIVLNALLVDSDSNTLTDVTVEHYRTKLFDRSNFYKLTKEELQDYEWYTDSFRYVFNANGTATQINQVDKSESTVNWQLEDGAITLNGETSLLLPIYPNGPGFTALELYAQDNHTQRGDAFRKGLFIKRASVTMDEADWVGRWNRVANNSFYSAIDYYSNHGYRDGFETQAFGSWKVISDSHISGLSNGTWRMENELLAIHDGKHYMQYCYGPDVEDFKPINCLLEAYAIDKTFSGTTFWESWSHPLFQDADTLAQWKFTGYSRQGQGESAVIYYQKVASNMLYDDNNGKVLEMLSSDKDSIRVCEYDAFNSCDEGSVYNLTRSLELTIKSDGHGSVGGYAGSGSIMFPRGTSHQFLLSPVDGYQITADNISGCDGTLSGNYYTIAARDTDCEVTVAFTPIP